MDLSFYREIKDVLTAFTHLSRNDLHYFVGGFICLFYFLYIKWQKKTPQWLWPLFLTLALALCMEGVDLYNNRKDGVIIPFWAHSADLLRTCAFPLIIYLFVQAKKLKNKTPFAP
jgi:hypothetical protein